MDTIFPKVIDFPVRVIITGAPGSGKSTLLLTLGKLGYSVMPESFRWLKVIQTIEEPAAFFRKPLNDEWFLFHLAVQSFLDDEESRKGHLIFYDRSFIDILAYANAYGLSERAVMVNRLAEVVAPKIFCAVLIAPSENIVGDVIRREDYIEASRLDSYLRLTYERMGIRIICIDRDDPHAMVERIIKSISSLVEG